MQYIPHEPFACFPSTIVSFACQRISHSLTTSASCDSLILERPRFHLSYILLILKPAKRVKQHLLRR